MKSTLFNSVPLGLVLLTLSTAVVLADHGNPWAGPDDQVKSQFHDVNQEKSLNTPGEDEMHGQTNRNVSLNAGSGAAGHASEGVEGGRGGGQGSGGQGSGGNGGGGHGGSGNGRGS
jgi:hypothetical protein